MQEGVNCICREPCTVDLKRDPNNPVWETYCPNAGTLIRPHGGQLGHGLNVRPALH